VNADLVASAKFKTVTYTVAYGSTSNTYNVQWGSNDTAFHFTTTISNITVTTTVSISVTDKNDINTSKTLTITVGAAAGLINSYTAVLLGSNNNNAVGSYLATTTGTVYKAGYKQTNSSVIDIIYGTTTNNVDEFFSPAISLSGITGGNFTKYATSTINFDNVTDDSLLQSITATNDEISGISVGAEFQFITHAGKKGIFKVTAYTAGSSGSVTINVKVQQ